VCNGAGLVASVVGRVSGMCVAGRLLEVALAAEAYTRVAKEFVVYGGRLSVVMYFSQEACIMLCRGVVSLGNFQSYVVAGRSRVALRISREVRREIFGPDLSPFGNLSMITLVGWIYRV